MIEERFFKWRLRIELSIDKQKFLMRTEMIRQGQQLIIMFFSV
jgi:hypothetical protein